MGFDIIIYHSNYLRSKLLVSLLIIVSLNSIAQEDNTENIKSFRELFTESSYHMEYKSFNLALPILLEMEKREPDNANIQYRIGQCYLKFSDNKAPAITHLEKAILQTAKNYDDLSFTEKNAPIIAFYELAKVYHLSGQLDTAIGTYTKYGSMISQKHYMQEDVAKQVESCRFAKKQMENPINVKITNLGEAVNSINGDYTPGVTADDSMLVFTSRREGSTGGSQNLEFDNRFFEDIYVSYKNAGNWQAPNKISTSINTDGNDAVISISADGQMILIYKPEGSGDIYQSFLMGNIWSVPEILGPTINTPGRETHASITSDGKFIYFTSEREEKNGVQFGSLDIYRSFKLPNGNWSKAINLGSSINTSYDENCPFIHPNGKRLYFSSKGHKSMGGYDIFFSDLNDDGTWTTPVNIGYPINTTNDDLYYVESPNGKTGYYSSTNSEKGLGRADIYSLEMDERKEIPLTIINGTMEIVGLDGISLSASIEVEDLTFNEKTNYKPNSNTGKFIFLLIPNKEYKINYLIEDSILASELLNTKKELFSSYNRKITLDGKISGSGMDSNNGKASIELPQNLESAEEEEAAKAAEEEAAAKAAEEEAAARSAEEEAAAAKAAEEEAAAKAAAEEAAAMAAEEAAAIAAEEEAAAMAAEEEADAKAAEEEAAARTAEEEAAAAMAAEEEAAAKAAAEEAAAKAAEEEAAAKAAAEEAAAMAAEEAAAKAAEEEAAAKAAADEAAAMAAEEAAAISAEEEAAAKAAEEAAAIAAEEEAAAKAAEEEAATKAVAEEEAAAKAAEEAAAKADEEEAAAAKSAEEEAVIIEEPVKANKVPVKSFTKHLGYNIKPLKKKDTEYFDLIEALAFNASQGYKQIVNIEASASKVPTTKFGSNEFLANERGENMKSLIISSLKKKGSNMDLFVFNINALVQGPEYEQGLANKKSVYKEFQYIKVTTE